MPRRRRKRHRKDRSDYLSLVETSQPWERPADDLHIDLPLYELLTGHDHFGLSFVSEEERRRTWEEVRGPFLARHLELHPGTRPWAWWHYDAPEPRLCLEGDPEQAYQPAGLWMGIPAAYGDAVYESEAAYLERLGLWAKGEAAAEAPKTEPADPATAYARAVLEEEIPAGQLVKHACRRHLEDLRQGWARPGDDLAFPKIYFDRRAVDRRLTFCRYLRHYQGRFHGQPFSPEPWQCFHKGAAYGWKREVEGLYVRRFRTVWREVARKNGKTFEAVDDGYYLLLADGEPGAELFSAATKRDQAKKMFGDANEIRKVSPVLHHLTEIRLNLIRMGSSTWRPLGRDSQREDSHNIHGALMDEVHEHPSGGMWRVMRSGMGSRTQPLMVAITTAGFDAHGFGGRRHELFRRVVDPEVDVHDDEAFVYIAAIDEPERWDDPEAWPQANPNLGISVSFSDLASQVNNAKNNPEDRNETLVKRLNLWTTQRETWLPLEPWKACTTAKDPVKWRLRMLEELKGEPCVGAIDLSSSRDLTCFGLMWKLGDRVVFIPWFWVPGESIEARVKNDRVRYDIWEKQGFLEATRSRVVDYQHLRARVLELAEIYPFTHVAYDPWRATETATRLEEQGLQMVACRQGYGTLSEPSRQLFEMILEGGLDHGSNPVLRWNAQNVSVERDAAGNIKPNRKNAEKERIDGIVAAIMCVWLLGKNREERSIYEDQDMMVL